ncbi:hypothetical protein [Natronorubrum tibetense]|uniref:Uncharacterized protein n=1 Tax=Natronorubrum tibetense GA33 TaxID=1114856 RepID=L9W905_9EURY|nr:hypothetical protein [Natronorubrum tibetense]ELY45852.1 hypothetical protein C496_02882 [Natronorubrum tibetense GA33]
MQFKPVPEPPSDIEAIGPILEAVPSEAGAVDDCCQHLIAETSLESRSEAETWLVFLRALELVTEEPAGYRRRSDAKGMIDGASPNSDRLQRAFRDRVYGADSVLEILERAETPLSTEEAGAEFRQRATASNRRSNVGRNRLDDGDRVNRLLEWTTLLGLGDRTDDGRYR